MKCPLFRLAVLANPRGKDGILTDCLKEKCAGWDKKIECCFIISLVDELEAIKANLGEIADKMPYKADCPSK